MSEERRSCVLVTGASRGVGASLCESLVGRGRSVVGVYRNSREQAEALARRLKPSLLLVQADLTQVQGIEGVVEACAKEGPLQGVVFNAGVSLRAPFTSERVEGVDPLLTQLRADLEAPLLLCRALLNADVIADGASMVFVSSNLARHGLAGKVAYSAAKAGLEAAVRGLARELGARSIRVNALAPGLLASDMTAELGEAGYQAYAKEVPLGRIGAVEDIAGPIAFLLGSDAAYISGQVIDVDGAWGA